MNPSTKEGQQAMFEGSEERASKESKETIHPLTGYRSLERLRDRVELAARELRRLRDENHALRHKVEELQATSLSSLEGTPVVFTESPAALRDKVEAFIEAIDDHLQTQNAS